MIAIIDNGESYRYSLEMACQEPSFTRRLKATALWRGYGI